MRNGTGTRCNIAPPNADMQVNDCSRDEDHSVSMPKIISAGLAGTAAGTVSGLGLAQLVSGPADPKHPDHASPLRSAMKIGAANGLVATMMTGVGMAAAYQGLRSARVATALSGFAVLGAGAGIGVGGSIVIAQHGIAASRATSSS